MCHTEPSLISAVNRFAERIGAHILSSNATADLLEIYREFTKANEYWDDYVKLKQNSI